MSDVVNIKSIAQSYLPNLNAKSLQLASKCIKDDGCPVGCLVCDPGHIESAFSTALTDIEKIVPVNEY